MTDTSTELTVESRATARDSTVSSPEGDLKTVVAEQLEVARRRSLELLAPLTEPQLVQQHSPLMSPLVWDLAHVGNYEEQWLVRAVGGDALRPEIDGIYDAFRHPRKDRPSLELLGPAEARDYIATVRGRVLDQLERVSIGESPLLDQAFVYGMVVQHEHQHDETMLATLQLMEGDAYRPDAPAPPAGGPVGPAEVRVDGGLFTMGTSTEPWAYDNERPAHTVDLPPFFIDTTPVTNGAYAAFIDDGGYAASRWWTEAGWQWRQEAGLEHPEFWRREGSGSWSRRRFGLVEDLPLDEPVQHVCWYEAEAFARWAGKRLPTEAEWEKAASWTPDGEKRRYPWGNDAPSARTANLSQRHFRPAPVGAYADGVSPWGCHQMIGDVWEWTSSDFVPYPEFSSFPYREYSEVFWGSDYKVLRGGSWAVHPSAVRATFRNWDYPIRRQIFSGFRCARDA
ncbi:MAG: ergothioneine biosynthesis protein EgtB [Actinobacteria bacterium]|nr:ergothioneine biosynthesis protein EgtB [Actinomycetota bacterium]